MVASQQDKSQVEAVIREWNEAFVATDPARLKGIWDNDYPQLMYIAEENNDCLRGSDAIATYYGGIPDFVESIDFSLTETTVDAIGDMAYAYVEFLAKASIKGVDHQMTFQGRNTFVLRKTGGQWKIIHYHESLSRDHSHETWGYLWS
jgi:uncharacterized protein (TIGR02246 family)